MIPSYRSLTNRSRDIGEIMPIISELRDLYGQGVTLRRGQLAMVAGRPGSQKSGFAMWLTAAWQLPTLYFAADMGEYVATQRDGSICSGMTSEEVSRALDDYRLKPALVETIKKKSNFRFVYDASPSLQDIDQEIDGWVEMHDAYPPVIVIDNLMDMEPINESEYASNKQLLLELKSLARVTGSFVLVLHHNREESNPAYPAPAKALQGKVSQTPELVLSVALDDRNPDYKVFRVAAVKNRSGAASPMADRWAELVPDPARTSFKVRAAYVPYPHQGGW